MIYKIISFALVVFIVLLIILQLIESKIRDKSHKEFLKNMKNYKSKENDKENHSS